MFDSCKHFLRKIVINFLFWQKQIQPNSVNVKNPAPIDSSLLSFPSSSNTSNLGSKFFMATVVSKRSNYTLFSPTLQEAPVHKSGKVSRLDWDRPSKVRGLSFFLFDWYFSPWWILMFGLGSILHWLAWRWRCRGPTWRRNLYYQVCVLWEPGRGCYHSALCLRSGVSSLLRLLQDCHGQCESVKVR